MPCCDARGKSLALPLAGLATDLLAHLILMRSFGVERLVAGLEARGVILDLDQLLTNLRTDLYPACFVAPEVLGLEQAVPVAVASAGRTAFGVQVELGAVLPDLEHRFRHVTPPSCRQLPPAG